MSKNIYWIDDDVEKIEYVIQGIFPKLWNVNPETSKEKMKTNILVFGNEFQGTSTEYLYTQSEENELQKRLDQYFYEESRNYAGPSWENIIYEENEGLVKDSVKVLFKKWTEEENLLNDNIEKKRENRKVELELFEKIKEYWQADNKTIKWENEEWRKKASEEVEQLILLMNIEEESIIGIDLALLRNDLVSVKEKGYPIVSMELHNKLKEKHKCFMYSTYLFDEELLPRCKEVYRKYYEDDFEVFKRSEIMQKDISDEIVERIIGK